MVFGVPKLGNPRDRRSLKEGVFNPGRLWAGQYLSVPLSNSGPVTRNPTFAGFADRKNEERGLRIED
jgi:hypothetical protein